MSISGTSPGEPSDADLTRGSSRPARVALRGLGIVWQASPGHATGIAVAALVSGLVPAGTVLFTERAITAISLEVGREGDGVLTAPVLTPVVALLGLTLVGHIAGLVDSYLQAVLQVRLSNDVTLRVMEKATRLELSDFENSETYDVLQRANREAGTRPYRMFVDVVSIIAGGCALLSVAAVLLAWNVWIGLAVVLSSVPSLIAEMFFGHVGWKIEHERSARRRWLSYLQFLVTNDRTVREVKSFRLSGMVLGNYRSTLADFYAIDRTVEGRQARATGLTGLLSLAVAGAAIYFAAATTVRSGEIGQFAGYIAAIATVQSSTAVLFSGIGQMYQHRLFLRELFVFLDAPERSLPEGLLSYPDRLSSGVEFRDVTFMYPGAQAPAIEGVSFAVKPGQIVAFVGANGAGKSTVIKLINRLYDPTAGEILVDGHPLAEYKLDEVRRASGVAFQDFVQYEVSARENITFGSIERVDDETLAWAAASKAGVDDVIRGLPAQMSTRLGRWFDDARQLSGGEWQRLAIARALIGAGPVIVLDEPTASVDTETEARLFARLREVAAGATCFLVSHRFSTVRQADAIYVLDRGRIIEHGDHEALMAAGGTYARMFDVQAQGYLVDHATTGSTTSSNDLPG